MRTRILLVGAVPLDESTSLEGLNLAFARCPAGEALAALEPLPTEVKPGPRMLVAAIDEADVADVADAACERGALVLALTAAPTGPLALALLATGRAVILPTGSPAPVVHAALEGMVHRLHRDQQWVPLLIQALGHDVSNQLQAVTMNASNLLRDPMTEEQQATIEDLEASAHAAGFILRQASALANRWMLGRPEAAVGVVDMAALIWERASMPGASNGFVSVDVPYGLLVEASAGAVRTLVDGMMLLASSREDEVVWAGERQGTRVVLTLDFQHPGLREAHLPLLVQPFGGMRVRRGGPPVAATGLEVPAWIARSLGGTIEVLQLAPRAFRILLDLPAADDPLELG